MTMVTIKGVDVDFRPLTAEQAARLQLICTALGLPDYCSFRACRRSRRCATRQVICYQALRHEINAIVDPIFNQRLAQGPQDDGVEPPEAPPTGRVAPRSASR